MKTKVKVCAVVVVVCGKMLLNKRSCSDCQYYLLLSVIVRALPQTPALDSGSFLFLESREYIGMVSKRVEM